MKATGCIMRSISPTWFYARVTKTTELSWIADCRNERNITTMKTVNSPILKEDCFLRVSE